MKIHLQGDNNKTEVVGAMLIIMCVIEHNYLEWLRPRSGCELFMKKEIISMVYASFTANYLTTPMSVAKLTIKTHCAGASLIAFSLASNFHSMVTLCTLVLGWVGLLISYNSE